MSAWTVIVANLIYDDTPVSWTDLMSNEENRRDAKNKQLLNQWFRAQVELDRNQT